MILGWEVINLSEASKYVLEEALDDIRDRLASRWGITVRLEDYAAEEHHSEIQIDLARMFIANRYGREIIQGVLPEFQKRLGMDLHIQKYPYFRIARPGRPEDNIGIHRDTKYGGTPYECSCVIPLTTMPLDGSLHVVDGSHTASEEEYPFTESETGVVKGSPKHELGFVYKKKKLASDISSRPVEVKVGQVLFFPQSLVHGQEVNRSSITRFSVDIRLVNSLAPILWERTVHKDFWEPLCSSPITAVAREYYARQG